MTVTSFPPVRNLSSPRRNMSYRKPPPVYIPSPPPSPPLPSPSELRYLSEPMNAVPAGWQEFVEQALSVNDPIGHLGPSLPREAPTNEAPMMFEIPSVRICDARSDGGNVASVPLSPMKVSRIAGRSRRSSTIRMSYRPPTPPLPKHSKKRPRPGDIVVTSASLSSRFAVASERVPMDISPYASETLQTASGPLEKQPVAMPFSSSRDPSYKTVKSQSSNIGLSTFQSDLEYDFVDRPEFLQSQFSRREVMSPFLRTFTFFYGVICRWFAILLKRLRSTHF